MRSQVLEKGERVDGRDLDTIRPITIETGRSAAHPRLGALHPGTDPGAGLGHAGHQRRRAADRQHRRGRRDHQVVHAALQLPAVLDRRSEDDARHQPPRDRARRAGRAGAAAAAAALRGLSLHPAGRLRDSRVERLLVDGHGLRRLAGADGRRRADEGALRRRGDGPDQGRRQGRDPDRHPRLRGPPGRHGLQGGRHREGHHLDPDGHQDRGPRAQDHGAGAGAGAQGPAAHPRRRWTRPCRSRATDLSQYAPRIITMQIKPDKIGDVIGPRARRSAGSRTPPAPRSASRIPAWSPSPRSAARPARRRAPWSQPSPPSPKSAGPTRGRSRAPPPSAPSSRSCPGVEGLLHISELQHGRTEKTEDVVKKGDIVQVKLLEVDERGPDEAVPEGAAAQGLALVETVQLDEGLFRTTAPNGLVVLTETLPGVRSAAVGHLRPHRQRARDPEQLGHLPPAGAHGVQGHRAPHAPGSSRWSWRCGAAASTPTPAATTPATRPMSSTPICPWRSRSSPIWSAARCSGRAISSPSATWCWRRSTGWPILRTIWCSSSTPRALWPQHPVRLLHPRHAARPWTALSAERPPRAASAAATTGATA